MGWFHHSAHRYTPVPPRQAPIMRRQDLSGRNPIVLSSVSSTLKLMSNVKTKFSLFGFMAAIGFLAGCAWDNSPPPYHTVIRYDPSRAHPYISNVAPDNAPSTRDWKTNHITGVGYGSTGPNAPRNSRASSRRRHIYTFRRLLWWSFGNDFNQRSIWQSGYHHWQSAQNGSHRDLPGHRAGPEQCESSPQLASTLDRTQSDPIQPEQFSSEPNVQHTKPDRSYEYQFRTNLHKSIHGSDKLLLEPGP